jgi:hypothetical protein
LHRRGLDAAFARDRDVLNRTVLARTALGDMLTALSSAAIALRSALRRPVDAWALIGAITYGRLLTRV